MCGVNTDLGDEGEGSVNQLGGVFLNGRPLPIYKRRLMIELASEGVRRCEISRILKVSNGCVSKILGRFQRTGVIGPKATGGSRPRLLTPDLISIIVQHKQKNPSMFAWEIREKLAVDGVCRGDKVPSVSSINRILKKINLDVDMMGGAYSSGQHSYTEQVSEQSLHTSPQKIEEQMDTHQRASVHHRTAFTPDQNQRLEEEFTRGLYPDLLTREQLSEETDLPQDTIKVWFSNRRARMRRERRFGHDDSGSLGFVMSTNALTSGSSLDAYTTQSPSSLPRHNDTFPLAHLNPIGMSACSLDHTHQFKQSCHHRNEEWAYRLVPLNAEERIVMQWACHQPLSGQNVSMLSIPNLHEH